MANSASEAPFAAIETGADRLTIGLSGAWRLADARRPAWAGLARGRAAPLVVALDRGLTRWDSSLALFLLDVRDWCERSGARLDIEALPQGLRELLAQAPPAGVEARAPRRPSPLARLGLAVEELWARARSSCEFVGLTTLALVNALRRPRKMRLSDWLLQVQQAGAEGLPIISLVSYLVGTIIAFQAVLQLRRFGAENLVVNLVDFSVAREMGVIIVGVVLSGRTAAAYAAELGSMNVGEELDALEVSGLSPVEFLVVPRVLALAFVTPLLTLYADLLAILGGASVASGMLKVPLIGFFITSKHALAFSDIRMGLVKSVAFGVIIAVCGCLRGLTCERDTAGVGRAATSAVVTSILWIVIADAVFGKYYSGAFG